MPYRPEMLDMPYSLFLGPSNLLHCQAACMASCSIHIWGTCLRMPSLIRCGSVCFCCHCAHVLMSIHHDVCLSVMSLIADMTKQSSTEGFHSISLARLHSHGNYGDFHAGTAVTLWGFTRKCPPHISLEHGYKIEIKWNEGGF